MPNNYTLKQDNGACNDSKILTVRLPKSCSDRVIKRVTGWRTRKTYDSMIDRLNASGSRERDEVILKLYSLGY